MSEKNWCDDLNPKRIVMQSRFHDKDNATLVTDSLVTDASEKLLMKTDLITYLLDNNKVDLLRGYFEDNKDIISLKLNCEVGERYTFAPVNEFKNIMEILNFNTTLKILDLSNHEGLRYGAFHNLNYLKLTLKNNKTLEELYMSYCFLDSHETIGEILKENKSLKKLHLQGNYIENIDPIIKGLKGNNTLKFLDLTRNPLPISQVLKLLNFVEKNKTNLEIWVSVNGHP
jgi:hypothetical protein